jgi:ribosomal protein S3AE
MGFSVAKQSTGTSTNKLVDLYMAYKFIRLLVTKWENLDAFTFGIIDKDGNRIRTKQIKTSQEKASYGPFTRLVLNLKRILNKIPFGKTKLASFATALFLLKEHLGLRSAKFLEEEFKKYLKQEHHEFYMNEMFQTECLTGDLYADISRGAIDVIAYYVDDNEDMLDVDFPHHKHKHKTVFLKDPTPVGRVFESNIYCGIDPLSMQQVYFSDADVKRYK